MKKWNWAWLAGAVACHLALAFLPFLLWQRIDVFGLVRQLFSLEGIFELFRLGSGAFWLVGSTLFAYLACLALSVLVPAAMLWRFFPRGAPAALASLGSAAIALGLYPLIGHPATSAYVRSRLAASPSGPSSTDTIQASHAAPRSPVKAERAARSPSAASRKRAAR